MRRYLSDEWLWRGGSDYLRPSQDTKWIRDEVERRYIIAKYGEGQAVLKVTQSCSDEAGTLSHVSYCARECDPKGRDPVDGIDQDGNILKPDDWKRTVSLWAADYSTRAGAGSKPRNTENFTLSVPAGRDKGALQTAADDFLRERFGGKYEYMTFNHAHESGVKPHVHVIIKRRGHDGKMMRRERGDIEIWRREFAEKCRDHGIMVDASRRIERGLNPNAPHWAMQRIRERGETPRYAHAADLRPHERAQRARELRKQSRFADAAKLYHLSPSHGVVKELRDREHAEAIAAAKILESHARNDPSIQPKAQVAARFARNFPDAKNEQDRASNQQDRDIEIDR